jgi:hypothetical protein
MNSQEAFSGVSELGSQVGSIALPLDGLLGGVTGERLGVHCGQAKEAGGAAQPGRSWLLDCLVCWVQAAWVVRRMEGELP